MKVLNYAGKYKKNVFIAALLIILAVACNVIPFFFIYQLIDPFVKGETIEVAFALRQVILVAICLVLNSLFYTWGLSVSHEGAYRTLENLRIRSQKKVEKLPMGVIEDLGSGTLKKLFTDDIEVLELPLAHALPEGIGNLTIVAFVFVAIFIVDWRLGLCSLAAVIIGFIFMSIMMYQGTSKMDAYYTAGKKMNKTIIEFVNGMEVVKIFNRNGDSYKKFISDIDDYRDFTLDWYKACWPSMALYSAFLPCVAFVMLPVGALLVHGGSLPLSEFILALCLSFSIGGPLMRVMTFGGIIPQLNYKITQIENLLNAEPLKEGSKTFEGCDYSVHYEDVTFAYKEKDVLHNVSFDVKPGTMTALIGESGSGKSTLAKLLVHFYDVKSGCIKIGNNSLTDLSLEELNKRISFVSQEQFLFNTSLYDNIKMGKPDATEDEILEAAKKAECMDFIEKLPNGIKSMAGDSGKMLSGGERQRISIARAILKDAPIIVLDEATAFVDPENEEKMNAAIASVIKGKTVIVIGHKLRSVMNADQIIVMKEGKICAKGKHEELIKTSDEYKKLWDISERSFAWKLGGENNA